MDNNVNLVLLRSVFEIALAIDLLRSRWNIHGLSYGSDSKESAHNAGDPGSIPGLRRRLWQSTPVSFLGKFHGHRSFVDTSKELDTIEQLTQAGTTMSWV